MTLAPADDLPFANDDIATAVFSALSWERSRGRRVVATADGPPIWHTARDTVAYVDERYPGGSSAARRPSEVLETLLTSKLKRQP